MPEIKSDTSNQATAAQAGPSKAAIASKSTEQAYDVGVEGKIKRMEVAEEVKARMNAPSNAPKAKESWKKKLSRFSRSLIESVNGSFVRGAKRVVTEPNSANDDLSEFTRISSGTGTVPGTLSSTPPPILIESPTDRPTSPEVIAASAPAPVPATVGTDKILADSAAIEEHEFPSSATVLSPVPVFPAAAAVGPAPPAAPADVAEDGHPSLAAPLTAIDSRPASFGVGILGNAPPGPVAVPPHTDAPGLALEDVPAEVPGPAAFPVDMPEEFPPPAAAHVPEPALVTVAAPIAVSPVPSNDPAVSSGSAVPMDTSSPDSVASYGSINEIPPVPIQFLDIDDAPGGYGIPFSPPATREIYRSLGITPPPRPGNGDHAGRG